MKINLRSIVLTGALVALSFTDSFGQKYVSRDAYIRFFGSTPIEDIEGVSNQGSSIVDTESGDVVFQVLMRGFTFEKALMQEHFNENYVESEQFPKATFAGKISNLSDVDFGTDGAYTVNLTGSFTIHGVSKPLTTTGTLTVKGTEILLESKFMITPEDHDIEIPSAVRDNIAKEFEVTVKAKYQQR